MAPFNLLTLVVTLSVRYSSRAAGEKANRQFEGILMLQKSGTGVETHRQ